MATDYKMLQRARDIFFFSNSRLYTEHLKKKIKKNK